MNSQMSTSPTKEHKFPCAADRLHPLAGDSEYSSRLLLSSHQLARPAETHCVSPNKISQGQLPPGSSIKQRDGDTRSGCPKEGHEVDVTGLRFFAASKSSPMYQKQMFIADLERFDGLQYHEIVTDALDAGFCLQIAHPHLKSRRTRSNLHLKSCTCG
ncbi:hypothetical protein CC86DRAFT_366372 [Ophiobolus disseminans]|uniref:Uncharacterized protein n=1 Tax=Ophiobolus disseminans TaxID=1469910 RepID=A0A6A7AHP5_9PLEO|nr:hypothetical protein CC86DRAFT_366372 [Ophiobolus disseminans]